MEMDVNKGLLIILLLFLCGGLNAQNEKFQINQSNVTLSEILKEIERKTDVRLVYSDDIINSGRKVSLSGSYTISEALQSLFKNTDIRFNYSKGKVILYQVKNEKKKRHVLSGYIREKESQELLPLANVYLPELGTGVPANGYGFYSITLPEDSLTIVFSYAGYSSTKIRLKITEDQELNMDLQSNHLLKEVVVVSSSEKESEKVEIGHINLPIDQMKNVPFILGEKDIFKVLQLLPGVKRGTEGSSGFYVRGGGSDQNLILLDDAPVYNANHLFGFFSAFNGNAIKSIDFFKGGFPARYGGRLSSILDMHMKEGNQNKTTGAASIGLISSNFTIEGPVKKGKISALFAARRTYFDVFAKPFINSGQGYYFYDVNSKINFNISDRNKIYLSGYFGKDDLHLKTDNNDYAFGWGNQTATLRWNHQFSNKIFSNTSFIFSNFNLSSSSNRSYQDTTYISRYTTAIRDFNIKYDADIFASSSHHVRVGLNIIAHRFTPGALIVKEQTNLNFTDLNNQVNDLETALYAEDEWQATQNLSFNMGLRLSGFSPTLNSMTVNPEPRITARYQLSDNWAVKAAYTKMNQYIHLLSNTGLGLPTDLWVPSTAKVPHETSRQAVFGIVHDLPNKRVSISIEAYSKKSDNIINYKPGSSFLSIDRPTSEQYIPWEDKVTSGQSWSNGIELLIQKKTGRLNGWIGYTLSKTEVQFDEINFGQKFYALYDRRHDLSVVAIYELNSKIRLSGTFILQSGNRITVPQTQYLAINNDLLRLQAGSWNLVTDYGPKNSFLTPVYHRLDLGIQFHKKKRNYERVWEIGLYNAYYRKNPFLYEVSVDNNHTYLKGVNIFPVVPSFSYHINF